jgi:hypothetical protein
MKKKPRKPGEVAPGKIAVLDRAGNLRGQVGKRATSVTAARFTGQTGAVLTRMKAGDKADSWCFPK